MKNDTRPLYSLIGATNGSAKKRAWGLRKKILLGTLIAAGILGAAWGFNQYQTMQAKAEYLEYAVAHNKPLEKALLEWGKIQYLKTHASLPTPPNYGGIYASDPKSVADLKAYNEQFLK